MGQYFSKTAPAAAPGHRSTLRMRAATLDDLDAIVRVVQAGFPDDPGCNYKFPRRHEHPDDFLRWTAREYQEYIEQAEKYTSLVVTEANDEPIAIGVWDVAMDTQSTGTNHGINDRLDASPEHMTAYAESFGAAVATHFARYGNDQLHLCMLITHPDFRCRGAGTMLCNWGRDEAHKRGNCPLTVLTSPMGERLYRELGYKSLGSVRAQVNGESEFVDIGIMEMKDV